MVQRKSTILKKLLVKDLKAILKAKGLKVGGKKSILVQRILDNNLDITGVKSSRVKKEISPERKKQLVEQLAKGREKKRLAKIELEMEMRDVAGDSLETVKEKDFREDLKLLKKKMTDRKKVKLPESIPEIELPEFKEIEDAMAIRELKVLETGLGDDLQPIEEFEGIGLIGPDPDGIFTEEEIAELNKIDIAEVEITQEDEDELQALMDQIPDDPEELAEVVVLDEEEEKQEELKTPTFRERLVIKLNKKRKEKMMRDLLILKEKLAEKLQRKRDMVIIDEDLESPEDFLIRSLEMETIEI